MKTGHIIITAETLEKESILKAKQVIHFESDSYYSLTEKSINQTLEIFGKEICWVCKVCDGTDCASGVPGMVVLVKWKHLKTTPLLLEKCKFSPLYQGE